MKGWPILLWLLLACLLLVRLPSALPLPLLPLYLPAQDALIKVLTGTCTCGSTPSLAFPLACTQHHQRSGSLCRSCRDWLRQFWSMLQNVSAHQQCVRQSLECPCHSCRPC